MQNYRDLPKFRDGLSYLYVEHCRVDQESQAIAVHDACGKTPVPVASLALLMLGPGTSITHAAVRVLADNGCLAMWCGEEGVRFYAQGTGETRHATNLLRQARLATDPDSRLQVVMRMYRMRFPEPLDDSLSIEQIRGMEGMRVRTAYTRASKLFGVEWYGRHYDRKNWGGGDPVNRALSSANSCLYGLCHAAIVSAGYSPALGFIHVGKQLSFVYDVADLYKAEVSIPVAFEMAAQGEEHLERAVRVRLRDMFREVRLLERIIPDIEKALDVKGEQPSCAEAMDLDGNPAYPMPLWDPPRETEEL